MNNAKSFDILAINLNVLYSYFDSSTKLYFWSVAPAKILDLSAKSFFPCIAYVLLLKFLCVSRPLVSSLETRSIITVES